MGLVTRCPKCQSGFEVTSDQLRLHDGLVRCGQCSHVFDGFACLQASLPTLTRKVEAPPDKGGQTTASDPSPSSPPGTSRSPLPDTSSISSPSPSSTVAPAVVRNPRSSDEDQGGTGAEITSAAFPRVTSATTAPTSAPSHSTAFSRFTPGGSPSGGSAPRDPILRDPPLRDSSPSEPMLKASTAQSPPPVRTAADRLRQDREPVLSSLASGSADKSGGDGPIRVMGEARLRSEDPSSVGRREPEFMEDEHEPSLLSRLFWSLFAIALCLVLALQVLVFFRNDIATSTPWTRTALVQLCARLGCEVNYVRQLDRIIIIGSSLQLVAGDQKGAQTYSLKLTLQNRNDHPQQWPSLLLSLNDASGTVVVRKVLSPEQYLPESIGKSPFGARQEMAIEMPITVSGFPVSGFELKRFFP